jgi:hypothetical protein
MQNTLVQGVYYTEADQHRRPQQRSTRALVGHGDLQPRTGRSCHVVPSHMPKRQLHLSWSLRITVCRQGPVLGRLQQPVELRSTPPRCMRRWRPPCSASEPTWPPPGADPSLVRAVGALSSLRPPGGTGTAVPVSAQKVSLVRQVLGRCGRKGDSGGGAADLATLHKCSLAWRRLPGAAGLGGLWAKWLATQSWPGVVPGPSGRTQSSSFRATAGVSLHGTTS